MIQYDLAKIGIRVKLVTDEWSAYRSGCRTARRRWRSTAGPATTATRTISSTCCSAAQRRAIGGNNIARWCNRDYDKLVNDAKLISDRAAREKLYRQAQVIFHDDAPWVPLAHSVVFMATRANVTGFKMDPLGRQAFEGVDFK